MFNSLITTNAVIAAMVDGFPGQIDNHYPSHKLIQALSLLDLSPLLTQAQPIPKATSVFTDAYKRQYGIVIQQAPGKSRALSKPHLLCAAC